MYKFFFLPITSLEISPFFANKLQTLVGGNRIIDLLLHFPNYFIQREKVNFIKEMNPSNQYILTVKILEHTPSLTKKSPYKILCGDESGVVILNFFHYNTKYLNTHFPIGQKIKIYGKVEVFDSHFCINHPTKIFSNEEDSTYEYEPIYPLTAGITNTMLVNIIGALLPRIPEIPNWLPAKPGFRESLIKIHTNPKSTEYRNRIALDELLTTKIAHSQLKKKNTLKHGKMINCDFDITPFTNKIPFTLTNDQITAVNNIKIDLSSNFPMSRLIQGDVGSGKTIVAIIAAYYAIRNNMQVAFLAPTEILAKQHVESFRKYFNDVNIELFSSKEKKIKKLNDLASGKIQIAIGTHALIQNDITFLNLGLVIIDEQHKFGVKQRSNLIEKGAGTNALYLSATPIPRTLAMTINGDMDISIIMEKPKNRIPITTSIVSNKNLQEITKKFLQKKDGRIYWVCPLITSSEKSDLQAATDRYEYLKKYFQDNVLLIHGKTKSEEKEKIMNHFQSGAFKILVSTTVIEVGIDVKDADVIIIEHAERFGLAQLHQLRGRVGRGVRKSFCVLMYDKKISAIARQRLQIIKDSEDGFEIAEKDLMIRGSGDILGIQQTGIPEFKIADLSNLSLFKELETVSITVDETSQNFYFEVFDKVITK